MKKLSKRNNTKLTVEKVALIKDLLKAGANQTQLAIQFRIGRAAINQIARKRAWADV